MIKIGKHTVSNLDIQNVNFTQLMEGRKAHILYTDPPWGDGNMSYWCTINKRQTGKSFEPMPYKRLILIVKSIIANHVDGFVFVETGNKWLNDTLTDLKDVIYNQKVFTLTYKSGSKILTNPVIVGTTNPNLQLPDLSDLEGALDEKSLQIAIPKLAKKDAILLDPCCGMGNSARSAIKNKMVFIGNEFNKKRLDKTIYSLKKDENIQ